jgi:pyridoxine 5-phosphate synthase
MARLCLCVNSIAKFRNLTKERIPDPASIAIAAEIAGIDGIIVQLREDRSDISDRDVSILKDVVQSHLNLAIPMNDDMIKKALRWLPDMVTLLPPVPDLTKEVSLDLENNYEYIEEIIAALRANNIVVSALVKPDMSQIRAAARLQIDYIQFNTFSISRIEDLITMNESMEQLKSATLAANKLRLGVSVGRGISYQNIRELRKVPFIDEFNVGYALISRAILVGIDRALSQFRIAMGLEREAE